MKIKILGKTDQLKGKAFERLMRILLDYLGYTDFRPDIHYTGMEVDLKGEAKDKVKQESILCEFKAHERPIGSEPLTDFFGKLSFKRSKNPSLKGLFASSSGFTGTALEMIDNDLTPVDRENLRLLNNADIVTLLTEIGLMMSQEKLDERIKNITPLDLGERYIVYLDAGLFIVQLLLVGGKPNHFVILTGKGQLAHRTIESEILELDNTLRSLTRIDLDILEKVTLSLLDMSEKTIKQISGEISETLTDCRVAVDELRFHEGIILDGKETTGSIRINEYIDTLKRLIKKFSESDNKYEFMSSRYIDLVVNDAFIDHVGNRFRLELNNQQKKNLITISKIFPSVLFTELFRYTVDFENNYNQVEGSQVSQEDKQKLHQQMVTFFLGHVILVKVLEDINNVSAEYINKKGIRGYHIRNLLRLSTDSGLIFDQEYRTSAYLAIASGTIKPGELVQGDIQTFAKVSTVLIDLKEYEDAIRYLDRIIENEDNLNLLKMSWDDKGLCLLRLKRCEEAIPFFEKVITHDPNHLEALTNLVYCLDSVGRFEEAKNVKDKLEKLK